MRMGLREANQHFSRAIKAVKGGREVVLTERGTPIAVIKPLRPSNPASPIDVTLQRLVAEGRATPAEAPGPVRRGRWKPLRIKGSLSAALRADRDAR